MLLCLLYLLFVAVEARRRIPKRTQASASLSWQLHVHDSNRGWLCWERTVWLHTMKVF